MTHDEIEALLREADKATIRDTQRLHDHSYMSRVLIAKLATALRTLLTENTRLREQRREFGERVWDAAVAECARKILVRARTAQEKGPMADQHPHVAELREGAAALHALLGVRMPLDAIEREMDGEGE